MPHGHFCFQCGNTFALGQADMSLNAPSRAFLFFNWAAIIPRKDRAPVSMPSRAFFFHHRCKNCLWKHVCGLNALTGIFVFNSLE